MKPEELEAVRDRPPVCIRGSVDRWTQTNLADFIPITPKERDALLAHIDTLEAENARLRHIIEEMLPMVPTYSDGHPRFHIESQRRIRALRERAAEALEADDAP